MCVQHCDPLRVEAEVDAALRQQLLGKISACERCKWRLCESIFGSQIFQRLGLRRESCVEPFCCRASSPRPLQSFRRVMQCCFATPEMFLNFTWLSGWHTTSNSETHSNAPTAMSLRITIDPCVIWQFSGRLYLKAALRVVSGPLWAECNQQLTPQWHIVTWVGEAVGKQLLVYVSSRDKSRISIHLGSFLGSLCESQSQYLQFLKLCFGLDHLLREMSHSLNAPLISLTGAGLCRSTGPPLLFLRLNQHSEVGAVRTKQRNWKMLKRSVDLKLPAELWSNFSLSLLQRVTFSHFVHYAHLEMDWCSFDIKFSHGLNRAFVQRPKYCWRPNRRRLQCELFPN